MSARLRSRSVLKNNEILQKGIFVTLLVTDP